LKVISESDFFCQTAKSEKDTFYLQKEEPARSCVMALGNLILAVDNQIYKIKRYEIYCFCFGKNSSCYLWIDQKTAKSYLLFVAGNLVNHSSLGIRERKQMKILKVDPNADLPKKLIESLLKDGLDLVRM
jgi:hypothetical protein